jgi:hypothetical protein
MISAANNSHKKYQIYFGVKLKFIPYFLKKKFLRQIATKLPKKTTTTDKKNQKKIVLGRQIYGEKNMLMYRYIQTHIVSVKLKRSKKKRL